MSSALLLLHALRLSNFAVGHMKDRGKDHVRPRKLSLIIQKPKLSTQALDD